MEVRLNLTTPLLNITPIIRDKMQDAIFERAIARYLQINDGIGQYLAMTLENTPVISSLVGHGPEDLAAHFGITDAQARNTADAMINQIKRSVRISPGTHLSPVVIAINAVENNWEEYLEAMPFGGVYESSPSEAMIDFGRWLLIDPEIDISTAAYYIEFNMYSKEASVSRSGRAIMKRLGEDYGSPYVLPSILRESLGENFIEYTLGQQGVAQTAMSILIDAIK